MLRLHKLYESRITIVVSIFGNYNHLTMNCAGALINPHTIVNPVPITLY